MSKLLDRLHDIDECQSFVRQAILDPWRYLEEGLTLHKTDLFQHLEPLRQRLGADIAQGLLQFAKAFRAREECVDDQERPHIAEQAQGAAHWMGGTCFELFSCLRVGRCIHSTSIPYFLLKNNILDKRNFQAYTYFRKESIKAERERATLPFPFPAESKTVFQWRQ